MKIKSKEGNIYTFVIHTSLTTPVGGIDLAMLFDLQFNFSKNQNQMLSKEVIWNVQAVVIALQVCDI